MAEARWSMETTARRYWLAQARAEMADEEAVYVDVERVTDVQDGGPGWWRGVADRVDTPNELARLGAWLLAVAQAEGGDADA